MNFNVIRTLQPSKSFRTDKVINTFNIDLASYKEVFKGEMNLPEEWNIGIIYGRSGTGKTTIARQLFNVFEEFEYDDRSVIDEMPQNKSVDEITRVFTLVGFSSPPSWLKSYQVLSEGEKMRVNLAKALLSDKNTIVFDEFTSVVDREVAKIICIVIKKAVIEMNKKFIAVTCHSDIAEWLEADWMFNTDSMQYVEVKKKRSQLSIQIHKGTIQDWRFFRKYHYLNDSINPSSQCFIARIKDRPVAFIAILHFPHPKVKNMKKVTRLVVLPDYQGIGIGLKLLEFIGSYVFQYRSRLTITTTHPAINRSLRKRNNWKLLRQGRTSNNTGISALNKTISNQRLTCSWEYINTR